MTGSSAAMTGKRGLVMGMANDRSIAWGIAQALAGSGAELAVTYQTEQLAKRVRPLAESLGAALVLPADVADDASMDVLFETLAAEWGRLDFVVHAIAFSDKDQLKGRYVDTTRENFRMSLDISCFSFTDLARRASALMEPGGAMLTLTYYGAEQVMPHYNVMGVAKAALEASVRYMAADFGIDGIRVNALSAGPVKTLAASGIGDFRFILRWNELNSPLQANVTLEQIGQSALYLLSPMSAGVTGEVHHVDCGYHTVGMMNPHRTSDTATCWRASSRNTADGLQRVRSGLSLHHMGREPRAGHRLRGGRLPARHSAWPGRPPGLARQAPARPVPLHHPAPGTGQRADTLRRVRGADDGHPHRPRDRECGPALPDYSKIADRFRPGHADYTYWRKYGIRDYRGGGGRRPARPPCGWRPEASRARCWARASRFAARWSRWARRPWTAPGGTGMRSGTIPSSARSPPRWRNGRTISIRSARPDRPLARLSRSSQKACRPASASRSMASSTATLPRR